MFHVTSDCVCPERKTGCHKSVHRTSCVPPVKLAKTEFGKNRSIIRNPLDACPVILSREVRGERITAFLYSYTA